MSNVYAYCRTSTPFQSLERQENNIKRIYPDALVYKEAFTGTKMDRPIWNKLMKRVREGDSIVFDEVSRMSRNANEGVEAYKMLYDKGVSLIFLKEPHINTDVYRDSIKRNIELTGNDITDLYIKATNQMFVLIAEKQIKIAFERSQKEVEFLHQRTREGMEVARQNGAKIGLEKGAVLNIKKKEPIKDIIIAKSRMFNGNNKDSDVIAIINGTKYVDDNGNTKCYHISNNTYYKYKREIYNEWFD